MRKNKQLYQILYITLILLFTISVSAAYAKPESRWWSASDIQNLSAHKDLKLGNGNIYYVDGKNGHDGNNGGSLREPFKTIARGVRELTEGGTLLIKSGKYPERFRVEKRGAKNNRIVIGPFGDGEVIIDASLDIGDWTHHKGNIYKAACPEKPTALVVNNKPLFPEYTLREVNEGKWFYDKKEKILYLYVPGGGDPTSHEIGIVEDSKKQHAIFLNHAQFVTLYGLTIKYGGGKGVEILGSNNRIERCDIAFNGNSGISMFNYGDNNSHGTEVIKNRIYHNFMRNWPRGRWKTGGWGKGIDGFEAEDTRIIGNVVYENGGEGIGVPGDQAIIRDNVVFDNYSVNIYACNRKNVLIERNLIFCNEPDEKVLYNNGDKNPGDGKCFRRLRAEGIMTADEKSPAITEKIDIVNNIIVNCRRGITHYGGAKGSGMKSILIAHNTIVLPNTRGKGEDFAGIKIPFNGGNNGAVIVRNNIVYAEHPSTILLQVKTDPFNRRKPLEGLLFDHNLWYHAKRKKPFHLGPAWFRFHDIDFKTWTKKGAYSGHADGSMFSDPGFQSNELFVKDGLKLKPNSKAINSGVKVRSIANDYDNNNREDGKPDIGAFEFVAEN